MPETFPDHVGTVTPPTTDPDDEAPVSVSSALERVRTRAAEIAKDKTLVLKVPGYGGLLAVKYQGIPKPEVDQFLTKASKAVNDGQLLAGNADFIIRCCADILVRNTEDDEWEPIDRENATTFSSGTLGRMIPDFIGDAQTARQEVFGLFSPEDSQMMAVGSHADALTKWFSGEAQEIEKDLLGK